MNKRIALLCVLLLCACALSACDQSTGLPEGYLPPLTVTGDVEQVLRIDRDSMESYAWSTVDKEGQTLPCLLLADLVAAASPWPSEHSSIYLIGADGLTAEIDGGDLAGCYVAFSEQFGWECINDNHPISSRIKMLDRILIESHNGDRGLRIISESGDNGSFLTPGILLKGAILHTLEFEGRSTINNREVTVYTPHLRSPLALESQRELCFVQRNGAMRYLRGQEPAFWEVVGNRIDLVWSGEVLEDVAAAVVNAPRRRITDTHDDALYLLEQGHRVLIIELDGWGYRMAQHAGVSGGHPFLSSLELQQALACYPTISPTGLAGMLTGTTPDVHGITSREQREFAGDDLFQEAGARGKACAYVEGESALIATSLQPVLSPDLGGVAGTDDEVYANALQALEEQPDLAFVHFHGIDDVATETGPYSAQTLDKMREVDGYVQALVEAWEGKVIITSDHGLRELPEGGTHGGLLAEELIVPYCILDSGNYRDGGLNRE